MQDSFRINELPNGLGIEVWSTRRLPFEPKGELLRLRDELRGALGALPAANGRVLHGLHQGSFGTKVDAENVLFYNVGSAAFGHLATEAIIFEMSPASPSSTSFPFYSRYELVADTKFASWELEAELARFASEEADADLRDRTSVWLATKRGQQISFRQHHGQPFGLVLSAQGSHVTGNLANAIKSIFDGVVAAFACHVDVPGSDGNVLSRISQESGVPIEEIGLHIHDDENAVLGAHRLAWCRANSYQWNPPDDLCVAGLLLRDQTQSRPLEGSLWSLRPVSTNATLSMKGVHLMSGERRKGTRHWESGS